MALDDTGRGLMRDRTLDASSDDSLRDLPGGRDTRVHRLLHATRAALDSGDWSKAHRFMDAAWRRARGTASVTEAYGRLLLQRGQFAAALERLRDAARIDDGPECAALIVEALHGGGLVEAARESLQASLHRFAVEPGDALAQSAHRVVAGGSDACGWVALSPSLELVGEVAALDSGGELVVRSASGDLILSHALSASSEAFTEFRIALPGGLPRTALSVAIDDVVPLLGTGLAFPPDPRLDGRATVEAGDVIGWITLGWSPSSTVQVIAEDGNGHRVQVPAVPGPSPRSPHEFRIGGEELNGFAGPVTVSALLLSGVSAPLPDGPLVLDGDAPSLAAGEKPATRSAHRPRSVSQPEQRRGVDVVIPVYLGREETMACIESVLKTVDGGTEVIVVDDASPDPALVADLRALARKGPITLLHNETNLGFPASVNRGMAFHKRRDVIVLNSDTVVHGNWLERLRAAAYSAPDIGTVTPLTDDDSIARYRIDGESDGDSVQSAAIDMLAARVNRGTTVDLPVGVGFCLYIRRDCLSDVGDLDTVTFGKGYGEENDFCMRAAGRGWRHVLAGDVFVHHAGGRSFGARRNALMERNSRRLVARYPEYPALVERFIAADPIAPLRRRLDEARLVASEGRHVLLVSLALTGGVDRFVRERCEALRAGGFSPLVLRPSDEGPGTCVLTGENGAFKSLRYRVADEIEGLKRLLQGLAIDHVEIHHFLDSDEALIDGVFGLGHPSDIYVHDYSWICPRLTLLGGNGRYCGEPALASCEACIRIYGSNRAGVPTVAALRERSARWLSMSRAVIVPCRDVADRITRHFPAIAPRIEPWEPVVERGVALNPGPGPVRVAIVGGIGVQKGYQVLLDCAEDAAARDLPIEFVVFGYTEDDEALFETGRAFVTGRYEDAEIRDLLRRERPHLAFFPSVTPETWCFALSHAMAAGLPVVAFDFGAIAERLRAGNYGTLIPWTANASDLNDSLLRLAHEAWGQDQARSDRKRDNKPLAATEPAIDGNSVGGGIAEGGRGALMANQHGPGDSYASADGLKASVSILTLPKGLFLFSVRTASPSRVAAAQNLTLPAVHVGLGPGAAPSQIEFLPGPETSGTWLCGFGNTLVANVLAPTVTLVLTSVRAPNGEVLSIELQRLDQPVDGRAAADVDGQTGDQPPSGAWLAEPGHADTVGLRTAGRAANRLPGHSDAKVEVVTHLAARGDVAFVDADWAGRQGRGSWIESFTVSLIDGLEGVDLEYKGLTSRGIETPWVAGGRSCGTRGQSIPLMGFAMRMKPTAESAPYDCEYSGYFQSGTVVGPIRNGVPCRSSIQNDPLEGIQVRIVRSPAAASGVDQSAAADSAEGAAETSNRPQFGKLREDAAAGAAFQRVALRQAADSGKANLSRFLKSKRTQGADIDGPRTAAFTSIDAHVATQGDDKAALPAFRRASNERQS